MSQKVVIPASVNCALEAARLIADVFLSEKILAWTASWRANENAEPFGWPITRQVIIRAETGPHDDQTVFTCRVLQKERGWNWRAEEVKVKYGKEEVGTFDFGLPYVSRLEDKIKKAKKAALEMICECLTATGQAERISSILTNLPEKFGLRMENGEVTAIHFSNRGRGQGQWGAVITFSRSAFEQDTVVLHGLEDRVILNFVKVNGFWMYCSMEA